MISYKINTIRILWYFHQRIFDFPTSYFPFKSLVFSQGTRRTTRRQSIPSYWRSSRRIIPTRTTFVFWHVKVVRKRWSRRSYIHPLWRPRGKWWTGGRSTSTLSFWIPSPVNTFTDSYPTLWARWAILRLNQTSIYSTSNFSRWFCNCCISIMYFGKWSAYINLWTAVLLNDYHLVNRQWAKFGVMYIQAKLINPIHFWSFFDALMMATHYLFYRQFGKLSLQPDTLAKIEQFLSNCPVFFS